MGKVCSSTKDAQFSKSVISMENLHLDPETYDLHQNTHCRINMPKLFYSSAAQNIKTMLKEMLKKLHHKCTELVMAHLSNKS